MSCTHAAATAGRRTGRGFPAGRAGWLVLLALAGAALLAPGPARAEPNVFEQQQIEQAALDAFKRVLTLWREEVYFELYEFGTAASRARISREDFAQRMVELDWVPEGEPNPKFTTPDYRFRTVVFIATRIPYRNKFDSAQRFTQAQTLVMLREDGTWRVDLVRLLRTPFA